MSFSWMQLFPSMQAHFSRPMVAAAVIIHLAADGTGFIDHTQCNITVQLVDSKESVHSLGENSYVKFQIALYSPLELDC